MTDWFILLAPLILMVLIFLFAFTGCGRIGYEIRPLITLRLNFPSFRLPSGVPSRVVFTLKNRDTDTIFVYPQSPPYELTEIDHYELEQTHLGIPTDERWEAKCFLWAREEGLVGERPIHPDGGAVCLFENSPVGALVIFTVFRDSDERVRLVATICD